MDLRNPAIIAAIDWPEAGAEPFQELIRKVADAGANGVRLRLFHWKDISDVPPLHSAALEPDVDAFHRAVDLARKCGLLVFGQPHAPWAVREMHGRVDAYKIASYDYGRGDIIGLCDDQQVFISTGQIPGQDLQVVKARFNKANWWHSVTEHPGQPRHAALWRIRHDHLCGYADHTLSPAVCTAAAALGVYFIEVPVVSEGDEFNYGCSPARFEEIVDAVQTARRSINRSGGRNLNFFKPLEPPYGRIVTRT